MVELRDSLQELYRLLHDRHSATWEGFKNVFNNLLWDVAKIMVRKDGNRGHGRGGDLSRAVKTKKLKREFLWLNDSLSASPRLA